MLHATLPYPPSVNHYWRHAVSRGRVRIYTSDEGKAYRRRVRSILDGVPKQDGRLSISVKVRPPDKRARDLDNLLKCLLDSLTAAGVWDDDDQVDEVVIFRDTPLPGGLVEVVIGQVRPEIVIDPD